MGAAKKIFETNKLRILNILIISIVKKILVFILNIYKFILSPIIHSISLSTVGGGCRFYPSCSEYAKQAIEKHGFCLTAFKMIFSRLLRCQPIKIKKIKKLIKNTKTSGYDPV